MIEIEYKMPSSGLGTDFSESERPLSFAEIYTNRFRNVTGGAERRPGENRFSGKIDGSPNLTRMHEWVGSDGSEVLMTSDNLGNLWTFSTTTSAWSLALTGKAQARMISAEADGKLIFCNGVDRNFYTENGGQTFSELKALIVDGTLAAGSNSTTVIDGNITNWISQTLISNNDIVHNITQGGYGIISTVATASVTATVIGSAGVANGAGVTITGQNQSPNDAYEIIDYVNLNVIPNGTPDKINVGTLSTGSTTTVIAVSGVNFSTTEIRTGDFVYNTTRGALAIVGDVSANINLAQTVSGQVVGDAIALFKSAMPIATWIHVHYGRVYYLDSRKQTRIVISAPDDPQDVTTFQQTLDSSSFSFDTLQPSGDIILSMTSFQAYFVAAGEKNLYIYQGITPVANTSSTTTNFNPLAFYPNGVASRFGLCTNGTDLLHATVDGLQAINIATVAFTTLQNNLSVPIRSYITNLIAKANADDIQLSYYPRRSWLILKVGDSVFILNTFPSYDETGQQRNSPSWHLFSGPWSQNNHYFIRRNGDLIGCGNQGLIYYLDNGALTDDGVIIPTSLVTAWFRIEEPNRTPRVKQGQYIRPIFESNPAVSYTINVVAGWDGLSSDSITVAAGNIGAAIGSFTIGTNAIGIGPVYVQAEKWPLRWRGEQARVGFSTASVAGPDVITGYMIYGDIGGVR